MDTPDDAKFEYYMDSLTGKKKGLLNRKRWDKYLLEICDKVSENSKCLSRKVGAILVRENRVLCTGYNGPPSGVMHCGERYIDDAKMVAELVTRGKDKDFNIFDNPPCPRRALGYPSGEGLEWCIAGHGERNVLITAAKFGVATNGAKLYMNCGVPCTPCLIEIINAGIEEIVITKVQYYDTMSEWLLKNSKLKYRVFDI